LLALAVFAVDTLVVDSQQANADNNNADSKKSCDHDRHHSGSAKCSHKDQTPFILPFP